MKRGLASSAGSYVPQEITWYVDVCGFDPTVWQHSFMGIGHEIISSAILSLLVFRVGLVVSYWPKRCTLSTGLSLRYNAPVICNHCHCPYWAGE